MFFLKIIWHLKMYVIYFFYKSIFRNRFILGKGSTWRSNFKILLGASGKLDIAEKCFFNNNCSIICLNSVDIGMGSIFGENVKIYDHNHKFNKKDVLIKEQGYSIGKVKIGKQCWIGSNVVILKNAVIEDNCVIGAGCVINDKIEKGSIVTMDGQKLIQKKINFVS